MNINKDESVPGKPCPVFKMTHYLYKLISKLIKYQRNCRTDWKMAKYCVLRNGILMVLIKLMKNGTITILLPFWLISVSCLCLRSCPSNCVARLRMLVDKMLKQNHTVAQSCLLQTKLFPLNRFSIRFKRPFFCAIWVSTSINYKRFFFCPIFIIWFF